MATGSSRVDRHDPQQAYTIFRDLVPQSAGVTVAQLLVDIITAAHNLEPASWSVSLFSEKLRINVGQVEVCTLRPGTCRIITTAPVTCADVPGLELREDNAPVYRAVPVPSAVVDIDLSVATVPEFCLQPLLEFVGEAASRKRGSPFRRAFSIGVLLFLERALETNLPRPAYFEDLEPVAVPSAPDEVVAVSPLVEGALRRIEVNAFERDARARRLCLEHYGRTCIVCGMSFEKVYGSLFARLIHVHHLRPLSEIRGEYQVDPIEDLRPVCPNCHAALHTTSPPLAVEALRALLREAGSA